MTRPPIAVSRSGHYIESAVLAPFIRYYGGKWRSVHAGRYPQPLHSTIVEPFAGAAGYACHYPHLNVLLVERYPVLAEMWRWLIAATPDDVRRIPLVDSVDDLPRWTDYGARTLVGFSMNAATSSPRRTLSTAARKLRENGRQLYGWTEALRERVASQVSRIKHWQIIEGDYTAAPNVEATWFIDPPYVMAGNHYPHGASEIHYAELAAWCRARKGQPIVCEQAGAKWLPFRTLGAAKSGPRTRVTLEAVWP